MRDHTRHLIRPSTDSGRRGVGIRGRLTRLCLRRFQDRLPAQVARLGDHQPVHVQPVHRRRDPVSGQRRQRDDALSTQRRRLRPRSRARRRRGPRDAGWRGVLCVLKLLVTHGQGNVGQRSERWQRHEATGCVFVERLGQRGGPDGDVGTQGGNARGQHFR